MRRLLALFFLFIFSVGCNSDRVPEGVIPQEKMIGVLTDMHLADGYTSILDSYRDTIEIASTYQSLYKKYNTDSAQVRNSLNYYSKHPKMLEDMYKVVTANLAQIEKEEPKKEKDRLKLEEKREKERRKALAKKLKLQKDSLKRDSIRKVGLKRDSLRKDSLRKDSLKKVLKVQGKRNGISPKRNR